MGSEDEVEQSLTRPCRQTSGRSKQTCELTSSIVPRGTSFHRGVSSSFPPIGFVRATYPREIPPAAQCNGWGANVRR